MNLFRRSILIAAPAALLLAFAFLSACKSARDPRFPYRPRPEVKACVDAFSAEQDPKKQIELLKGFVKKYPRVVEVHRAYQELMNELGQGDEILKEYLELQHLNPDDAMANYLAGRLIVGAEAEAYMNRSLKADPDYYWSHLGLANYYYNVSQPGKKDLALDHLLKAIKADPSKPDAYMNALAYYRDQMDRSKILETLEILIQFFPEADELYVDYAGFKFPDASAHKEALLRKLKALPHSALIKKNIADLLLLEGKAEDALGYLEDGAKDSRDNLALQANIHYMAADLYARRKDARLALAHLKDAVASGYRDPVSIRENPNFRELQTDGEFQTLLKGLEEKKPAPSKPVVPSKK